MNLYAFISLFCALQIICLIVAKKSSKDLNNQDDYFLAGKSIRFFPLMMTFIATQVGGGLLLGAAEEAYQFGWMVLFYPLGASLGLILLGVGLGRRLAQFKVSTIAQIFEVTYQSANLKKIASLLSIISLFMIFIAQIIASKKFMISLGIDNNLLFMAFWGIVILYTAMGGLKAVVATDVVQAAFFVVIFLLCLGYVLYQDVDVNLTLLKLSNESSTFNFSKTYSWLFMPLLFMIIEQDMGQRCFAAITPKTVSKATLYAAFVTFSISMISVFFGILAKEKGIEVAKGASVLITVINQVTTPFLAALASCAILAAIISTADSLINAISSNLSQDFDLSFIKGNRIRNLQIITSVIALSGIIFSFYFTNVINILIQSYELSISCLFIPILFALFKKQGNTLSATLAITLGAIGFVLFKMIPMELPKEIFSLMLSAIGFGCGEIISWYSSLEIKGAQVD